MLDYDKPFIEVQFPVSKVSKESYKERKANLGQTLTGLGKWWGRKPLILARAAILGLLMPVSKDPVKDREIFLKVLSMDDEGLWQRKKKSISIQEIYDNLTKNEQQRYFEKDTKGKLKYKKSVTKDERINLQKLIFNRFSYDQKLTYCIRPEELENIAQDQWVIINEHLGTKAANIQELVQQLGEKKFGKTPVIGDCFAGGGSVPFEAARLGCDVYASDLNPIAMLLTWAALNINGSSDEEIEELKGFQEKIFNLADMQITEWGIEHNEQGHRANSYLYCHETICPECGYKVPLAPSWIIGKGTKTVALLKENENMGFDIDIVSNASNEQIKIAECLATIENNSLKCPNSHCKNSTPITTIRKDRKINGSIKYGLRQWGAKEFIPREDDVFQERLYCVRYVQEYLDDRGNVKTKRYYQAPTKDDLVREEKVVELLRERFDEWQEKGYLPSSGIEEGDETTRLLRERGWAYWHQLFNPRQLLVHGLLMKLIEQFAETKEQKAIGLLGINKCCDWNSKLGVWHSGAGVENSQNTFLNQALNTLYNYGIRGISNLRNSWYFTIKNNCLSSEMLICLNDARQVEKACSFWITDPPYADAVNYHELSEFFLAWDKKTLLEIFPEWYTDSKRALAVTGSGLSFNESMIEIYSNLTKHMPDNGMQIVMFTHQDPSVWAELTLILWSAGLRVTTAWNIATETESGGLKNGNYVKGTVLLVLRKQESADTAYFDELYPEVEEEVKRQIDSMRELDDKEDPNFSDADYLLAAYAASLKVLTSYKKIEDIDVKYELSKDRNSGEESPIEKIINESIKIAYDYLTPPGFYSFTWKTLKPEERFYIKGLEFEKDGIYQIGAYQELARGFGVKEYKDLLANTKANQTRLKTATEWSMKGMSETDNFGSSLLRNLLAALYQCIKGEDTSKGKNWLKNEVPSYWNQRNTIMELLDFLITLGHHEHMEHWDKEVYYATMLRELVKNDGV